MKRIDVHDLPEGEAQFVAAFVEFLHRRKHMRAAEAVQALDTAAPYEHL